MYMQEQKDALHSEASLQQPPINFQLRIALFSALLILLLGIIVLLYIFRTPGKIYNSSADQRTDKTSDLVITPTPFPFSELTIPYLQNRTYDGVLSSQRQLAYETSTYTAYTTSYDSEGLNINGLLTIPKGNEPVDGFPAIVFVHGYIPPASYQTTQNYYDYVDYLARNGFVVFKIDLRGHGNSEGEPGGAYYSSDYIIDTLNAHNALQESDLVNSKKIGLWGHSMAGNVISRALAVKKDIPAISIWGGAVYTYDDWKKYGIQDGSYVAPPSNSQRVSKRQQLFNTHGEFSANSAFWKQVPMTNYLDGITGAVQLNHAVDDNVVNVGYSRDLAKLLEESSVPYELQEYNSGGHNITGAAFNQAMQNTVNFFNTYLK